MRKQRVSEAGDSDLQCIQLIATPEHMDRSTALDYARRPHSRARMLINAAIVWAFSISALLTAPAVLARSDDDQSVVKLAKDLWQQTDKNPIGFLNRAMPRYGDKNTDA